MSKKHMVTGSLLLGVSALISRLLGVYRDHLFAVKFGAGSGNVLYDLDTYFAAFRIPDFLYNILILGTVSVALVPIFTGYIVEEKKKEGFEFINSVTNFLLFIMLALGIIIAMFSRELSSVLFPGFSGEKLEQTIMLTRIIMVSPIFFALSSIAQSIQNTFKTFLAFALAPVIYNISIIGTAIFFSEQFGVYALAFGVILGSFAHFAIQIPAILKTGYRYQAVLAWRKNDFQEMLHLIGPRLLGISAMQILLLSDTFIASLLTAGSISIFNFSANLNWLPVGMVGISLSIASFATFSELAKKGGKEHFVKELSRVIEWTLLFIVPATFGMFILRKEITELILQGGAFSAEDTILTAKTLGFFVVSIVAQSLIPIFARGFYAWKDTKTPVLAACATVVINIAFSVGFALGLDMGVFGIALAYSLAQFFQFFLLLIFLKKRFGDFSAIFPIQSFLKFLLASLVMTVALLAGKRVFEYLAWPETFLHGVIKTSVLIFISIVIYGGCVWLVIKKRGGDFRENN
ncbi:murein biosynthesis integral membrane protein MurJ [Candidatus Peregrinibacteria bacterium]|nr:murein biosynthesis integral membrane protein MurJ [Candidatus Peregrinibacteria bacterium]